MFLKTFYGERKKKIINFITVFYIFNENGAKNFLKLFINYCLKGIY